MKKSLLFFALITTSLFELFSQSITVTAPNGGEQWAPGTSQTIGWTSAGGITDVNIFYSTNNGTSFSLVAAFQPNSGTYSWTIPSANSTQCLVRVVDFNNSLTADTSDAVFTIAVPASITVTHPNGGEMLTAGATDTITWTSTGTIDYLEFYYSTDAGSTWNFIDDGIQNTGSYVWSVPSVSSTNCLVLINEIGGSGATDTSNAVFSISTPANTITVISPNGGENFVAGTTDTITWTSTGGFSTAEIWLSTDAGFSYSYIDDLAPNTGSYIWVVPNIPSSECYIKINEMGNTSVFDVSNALFTISAPSASVTLISPDGGEQWAVGSTQNITWTSSGITSNVILKYSVNYGQTWTLIDGAAPNTGSYSWTVPNIPQCTTKVKISDYSDTTIYDISSASFCINAVSASLTLNSPDGGENWIVGTPYNITWTYTGTINTVDLYYSVNGGSTWSFINDFITNSGSYSWTVPNYPSANCKIKVVDTNNPTTIYDVSDSAFTISSGTQQSGAYYTVTSPNGGEAWYAQSNHYIYWTDDSVSNYVNLEYSINNGSSWNIIVSGTYNSGSYNWTLPNYPSSNCKVRISDYYDSTITDISDNVFTILAAPSTITVSTPNNGETWAAGSNQYIYWSSQYVDSVKIEYTTNNGSSWNLAVASAPASAGSYYWAVPNTPSDFCKVRISQVGNPSVFDVSDNVFKIILSDITVTTPNGGEMWTGSEYKYIYWNSTGISSYVKIDYSLDNGTSWTNIVNGAYNYGYYNWYIPNTPSTQCLIKVSDYYTNSINDSSDNVFSILAAPPTITVSTPNNGETWAEGSNQYIYWSSQYIDSVKIEYTINNGSSWNLVAASALASNGSYYWSVPNTPSDFCKVRISQVGNPSVFDLSDNVFKIVPTDITVTTPNGGEVWTGNTYQYIYWNSTGVSNYVKIDYSTDNGATWINIVNGAYNYGYYNWYVANSPSTQCLVKVSDYYSNSITDSSNATFTISAAIPSITVTTPNGGEQWLGGSSQYIYWNATNSNNVKVEYSIDNGLSWNTIVASTPAGNGYYYWNPLPSTPSAQCLVKVSDVTQSQYYDASNSTFSILDPYITVTDPNGGETYIIGSNRYIYWNYGGTSSYVTIEYSTDGGSSWNTIVAGASNGGSYYWNVPNTPSTTCKMRISDYYTASIYDVSDNNFTIATGGTTGTITVSTPNGSEQWTAGSSYYIYWSSDMVDSVNIYYSTNNGSSYTLIAGNVAASTGYYYWSPVPATPSNQCRVKVASSSNSSIYDASNNTFSIIVPSYTVTSPNGGEVLTGGTYSYIYWTSQGVSSYVRLDYSIDNGATWTNITNGSSNSGSYNWYVPDAPSTQCLIKVMDYYNNSIADSSNAVFTINPATPILTLSAPNGGQNILVGASYGIQWTTSFVDSVKIEYSTDNGSTWNLIAASVPATNNYYTWTPVPNTPSTQCLVKISDVSNSSYFDISNYVFSISQPYLLVTTPNGGESWTAYNYKYIYWTGAITASYVRIDYSVNNGATWNNIVNGASNNNQYQWYVPDSPSVNCLIKVSDYYDTTVNDVSDAVFTINAPTPVIALSAPNGGQNLIVGSSYGIQWSTSYIDSIRIEYSTDNGATWNMVAASLLASNNYYTWSPIPNTPSNQCLVKITDISDSTYFDVSNYSFTITQPYLMISTPNGGEAWTGNTYKYIYWSGAITASYVKIDYSVNGGATWNLIVNGASNNNQYQWYVPDSPSVNCLVKVSDYYDTTVNDMSDAVFTINAPLPSVTVTTPNGGQSWIAGSSQYIYWSSANIANVKLEYSINNGNSWTTIISSTPASNGYYYWPVPNVNSTLCKVRITNTSDSSVFDVSDNVFSIIIPNITVTTPNGGEVWTPGTNQYIYWSGSGLSNYVNIWYSTDAGSSWTSIANGTYNNGYYNWSVPNSPSTNCLVKISDYYDTSVVDVSNAVFTIGTVTPTLTLTTPNGGEIWYVGTSQYIYWSSSFVTNVKIEYSTNNGSSWSTIIASANASNGYYLWTIPNAPSDLCLVKITDVSDTSIYDISNYTFSIIVPFITVTTPNGGEVWNCNQYNYIYWDDGGLSNYVNLEYSTDGGANWTNIANGTYNYGYYNWYVPAIPSANCKIRVTDYYTSSLTDVSDSAFTIDCSNQSITVTTPNGGEQWGVGTGNYIYWTSNNVTNVKIQYSVNSGSSWTTVASSVPAGNGSYWWTIPNTPSTQCRVKISDVVDSSITDMSNSNFSIVNPTITVTQPNGSEQWTAGNSQYITWTSSGISNYVTIYYSINNGSSWNTVANGVANNGYYWWTVPNNPSANCKVKIVDYYNSSLFDASDNTFTILAPPPSLTLTDPDGGEVFAVGSTQYIYWTSASISYVKLEYSYNGGSTWNVVVSSTPASNGYYSWPVPNTPTTTALVRVSDASNPGMNDASNGNFSIVLPNITVTTPNGGESWTGLTNNYIYWNSTGVSNYVTIEYSINNGASWSMISNGTYNNGYYNWSVPNSPSANCLVRVKDYYNNSVFDVSNNTFTILAAPASIVVNSPNGGESWGVGTSKNITWSSSGVSNVKLEYSTNGGSTWNVIIASTPASSGYYSWPVPNAPSTNCYVKISDASNGSITDQSNYYFTITSPLITVTSPNGGETWTAGTGYYIYWTSSGISNYVKIQYSTDNGASWNNIANSAYNNGSYWWTVPNTPSNNCLVRVTDYYNSSAYDVSNSVFSIVSPPPSITVTSPNGGETWVVGSTYYIYWNSTGVSNVKLEYSTNGGSTWNTIISSATNNGSYNWPVPNAPSTTCLVKVSDAVNPGTNDVSNNNFTISAPYITLTQPNGGEILQATNGYYITWASAGVSYARIEYSIDNGANWNMIVSSTYNNGYYYWTVPNNPSTNCLVKVSSTVNPTTVNDQSNSVFTIIPPVPTITLNSPNSGEYWYVGYQYYITWSSSAVSNVKLEYSTDGGSNWNLIIASTPANSGFYYWPVPNTPSVNCKVRVSDAANATVNDFSYGMFTIATPVPSVTVNYPNGGENWYEGSYQYVSWTKNFVNTVNLEYSIDSGTTWNMLISNSSANYYYWNIPATPSVLCLVKVTAATDTSVSDMSDGVFNISIYIPNTNTIATDSIAALPFCKEDTFNVFFTVDGVFNSGNVFTAQLSDSNGNFNYPVAIGSLADTASGSIACVVSSNVMNASGYRIRVVASDLPTTGTDNGTDISISSPEFDFAASETIKYLPDGTVQFAFIGDTGSVSSYEWSMGNGDSATVSDPSYVYSSIGYYTVDLTVTDTNGCDISLSKYNYMRIEQLLPNTQLSTNTTVDLTDVYFSDIATGIMTMADGNCLITLDSGNTWITSYTGLSGFAASVSMQPGYWFITGANGSIVYSIDSGLTWLPQYTGTLETFYGSSFSAPNFGFSVGTNGIIYNYNGTSWAAQTSGISAALNSVFTLGSIAYSVGVNGSILYYNGSSWVTQTAPVSANLNSVHFTGASTGLAVGDNGYILNYDGSNWNVALSGVDVNFSSVTATGDSAWAVSNSGIIYWSDDAGLSWMRYSVGSTTDLSGISYIKSGGKAASSSRGYIGGKGGEGRMIGSEGAEDTTTVIRQTVIAKNNFLVYPNPALDIIYLETALDKKESMVIQLRDINGNLVKTIADAEVSGFYREQVNVSSLASGIYFVHVSQGEKFWVRKIVVQ